jgi:hypothetical protein
LRANAAVNPKAVSKHFSFFAVFLDALSDPAIPVRAHPDEIASQGAERHYDYAEVWEEPPDGGAEMAGKLRRGNQRSGVTTKSRRELPRK